ncbi:uncharacterized protein LOC110720699 [Chenopodium quinoa]|uniref:Uncharacterized protein n=1 Tax=Chenopodium quinoa TaxID=63459 RepID=A0A803LY29_CHEQI|nr:uncharacterized protein LOC110720699 [Chenopodium quinoa]
MASYHTRSFSFPSNSHPVSEQLDQQLNRLRSSQAASTSSLTSKLSGLNDLYKCVEEFLQLPKNQKTVSQSQQVLDGSLRLIDICSTSRDVLAVSKEQIQNIQSVLRRRCSGELDITNEVTEYLKTRRASKKTIKKCLKDIKAKSSWSISKLVRQRSEKEVATSFDAVDAILVKKVNVDMSQLVNLESEIQEIDEVLESLFRHLVKTRSTLLNVISN